MNDRIVAITFPKCGTCRFAQVPFKGGLADCYGKPPVPLVLGAGQDALGRTALQIEAMVPRVKEDRNACSLHQVRLDFQTDGRS